MKNIVFSLSESMNFYGIAINIIMENAAPTIAMQDFVNLRIFQHGAYFHLSHDNIRKGIFF
ncbi:hypothetical protein HZS_5638 [Henneguya salminicola]|nr:hypothetical protein HZS_5638 [Henneguya salminicola]